MLFLLLFFADLSVFAPLRECFYVLPQNMAQRTGESVGRFSSAAEKILRIVLHASFAIHLTSITYDGKKKTSKPRMVWRQ
jgi:hypothetical protein